jgi:hypothetical protein
MKAQHRHELQTNILADRMGRLLQGMRTAPNSTSILVWVFVILALGTYALWQYQASASQTQRSEQWTKVDTGTHEAEDGTKTLDTLGKEHSGSIAGRTANFTLARIKFQAAQENLDGFHRSEAVRQLREARDLYAKLAKQCADSPALTQEALMALAKAEESLAGIAVPREEEKKGTDSDTAKEEEPKAYYGSLDKALEYYRELAERYPDSPLGGAAVLRVEQLENPETRAQIEKVYTELNALSPLRSSAIK